MLKLLGSGCLLLAGGLVRAGQIRTARRRLSVLRGLIGALEEMGDEIRLSRTPMPLLLRSAGRGRGADVAAFFYAVSRDACTASLPAAWSGAAQALPLGERERSAVAELGRKLCGDEEQACKGILLATNFLARTLEELQQRQPELEKRSTALCFSGAALLIILLI